MRGKRIVFNDLLKYLPRKIFDESVKREGGDKWCKNFYYWDLFVLLLEGQLKGAKSLRSLVVNHNCQRQQLKVLGVKEVSLSTLSDALGRREPEVLMNIFRYLESELRRNHKGLYKKQKKFIQIIDSTPNQLIGRGYEWAKDSYRIKGLKTHVLYDDELASPIEIRITAANVNDITPAKDLEIKGGGIYVFDKGYYDYRWWKKIHDRGSYFVSRLKTSAPLKIIAKRSVEAAHLVHDWTIRINSRRGKSYYKEALRHIRVKLSARKTITIMSNDLESPAEWIAELYKRRWKIETFFKSIKQNLMIKRFWGRSENAVRLQIIIGLIAYLLLKMVQIHIRNKLTIKELIIIISCRLYEAANIWKILKPPNKHQMPRNRNILSIDF